MKPFKTLYLVDISSFIFRAFYAIRELNTASGQPVNAIYGVANQLSRLIEVKQPDYLAVVYDSKEPSFRKTLYSDYKANRDAPPEALIPQFDGVEQLIRAMKIPSFRKSGIEADDLIATATKKWIDLDPEHNRVVIVSGDKDLMALVDSRVQIWDTMKEVFYSEHEVIEKFGVRPDQIRDYLSIVGDSSDNIPGISGLGAKGAVALLQEHQTLENIIEAAKSGKISGKRAQNIIDGQASAKISQELATLKMDCEMDLDNDSVMFTFRPDENLFHLLNQFEFKTLEAKWRKKIPTPNASGNHRDSQDGTQAEFNLGGPPLSSVRNDFPHLSFICVRDKDSWAKLVDLIKEKKCVSVDTETTALEPEQANLVGVALAVDSVSGYYVPLGHVESDGVTRCGDQLAWNDIETDLKQILADTSIKKVGQNLKYDARILGLLGCEFQGIVGDTLLASYAIDASGRHNLDVLAQKYLGYETLKYEDVTGKGAKQVTFDRVPIDVATRYSAEDAWCAFALWEQLDSRLDLTARKVYEEFDLPLIGVVTRMEARGIRLDRDQMIALRDEFQATLQDLESRVRSITHKPELNLNSPKQLAVVLFDELKLPVISKTKTGVSTDASVLEKLAPLHEVPRLILEHREVSKLMGTYVEPLIEMSLKSPRSRIHTSFHLTGTSTGRLSSSDPNLQNIPARSARGQRIRSAFVADTGFQLMSADYSQIELRVLAHLSEDINLMRSFEIGEDVHRRTASEIFHLDVTRVTDEQRSFAKAINFGLMYGKTPFGLSEELGIPRGEAKAMIESYFQRYSGVKHYLNASVEWARERGYTQTAFGRRRSLPEIRSQSGMIRANAERVAMNAPIQGTAADLIKKAMIEIDLQLQKNHLKSRLLLQVHDELILEVHHEETERVTTLVRSCMESAGQFRVPLVVNIGIAQNWQDA